MIRSLILALCLLLPLAVHAAAPPTNVSAPMSELDQCASGRVRGGGYDELSDSYAWTCGNYPWSAEIGGYTAAGVPKYGTPTTEGGNSWYMECSASGVGNPGSGIEQDVCLHAGERIKMYSTADLVLALDQTSPGGSVYMPPGLYHFAYCGQQPDGTANGCPVTRESNGTMIRKWVVYGNRKIVGAGRDLDGPYSNGRTGTWFINDGGADNDADSSFVDDVPDYQNITEGGIGSTYFAGHWAWHGGQKETREVCARNAGSTACNVDAGLTNWSNEGSLGQSPINAGYTSNAIYADSTNWDFGGSQFPELCLHDTIGVGGEGVCSGDTRVQCTSNTGARTGYNSGSCEAIGLGTCIGFYSAIAQEVAALPSGEHGFLRVPTLGMGTYGTAASHTGTSQVFYLPIAADGFTGTTCGAGSAGKLVRIGGPVDQDGRYGFTNFPAYLKASQPGQAYFVPESRLNHYDTGVSDLSIMPKDWYRGPTCATGGEAGCDEQEVVSLSGGYGVFWRRIATWFASGSAAGTHYGFSVVDGDPGCVNCELGWSLISDYYGLASDASGWWYHDNVWTNNLTVTGGESLAVLKLSFGPDARLERDTFQNSAFEHLISPQNSTGLTIRDIRTENTKAFVAYFRFKGVHGFTIDGWTGQANSGTLFALEGGAATQTQDNVHISGVRLKNHSLSNNSRAQALWLRTNYGGTASFDTRYYGANVWRDSSVQVHGDLNLCMFFWDGYEGDESNADHGLNFVTDDDRNMFHFENIDLEVYDDGSKAGTQVPFCFGDHASATGNGPTGADIDQIGSILGPVPSWRNVSIGSADIPDNPFASMTSEQAGDCGTLLHGSVARVHDSDTAGVCEDTDSNGIMDPESADNVGFTAVCKCDPTGNAGTGLWSPL